MNKNSLKVDIVVVGGGIAGLAAGALAASNNASVLVLEAHQLGGRARSVNRDGFIFNLGAHALYQGGMAMQILHSLGIYPRGTPPPLKRYRALIGQELHKMPTTPANLLTSTALGFRAKIRLVRALSSIDQLSADQFFERSAGSWIANLGLPEEAESILRAICRLSSYVGELDEVSADVIVSQLQIGRRGVLYLHDGWRQLVEALSFLVPYRVGCGVEKLLPTRDHIEVHTQSQVFAAKAVIVATGIPSATGLLLNNSSFTSSGSDVTAACLGVGVSHVPEPGYVLDIDKPLYATTQLTQANQSPTDRAVVEVVRYGARSAKLDRQALEAHLCFAGVNASDIVTSRFLPAMTVAGVLPTPSSGGLAGRRSVYESGIPGVFLAGDWIGPKGWLADAALASAQEASNAALAWSAHQSLSRSIHLTAQKTTSDSTDGYPEESI